MNKIKVLHISQATGGVQRHVIDITAKIDRNKFDITGICPPQDLIKGVSLDKESFLDAFKRIGVKVYPVKMHRRIRPASDLSAFIKIYNFIRKEGFDVVHTHSSKAGFLGRIAGKLAGVPVITHTPNNFAFDRPGYMAAQRVFFALLEKFAGLFCDMVMAVCEDEKNLAVRLGILPEKKITVISNVIDISKLNFNTDVSKKRRDLGIGEGRRIVVSAGRLALQKSPKDFVLAAKKALSVKKDAMFLFLGDGPLLKETRTLIENNALSGYVRLLGWRNDAAEIIAACDIFVLSSLWEVLPNHSLLDAMAFGKPMVITATSGARDVVVDGVNGYVVPVGRYDMLADSILKLLDLPAPRLKEWGNRSREMFEKRPTPEDVAKIIENTYVGLLRKKGGLDGQKI